MMKYKITLTLILCGTLLALVPQLLEYQTKQATPQNETSQGGTVIISGRHETPWMTYTCIALGGVMILSALFQLLPQPKPSVPPQPEIPAQPKLDRTASSIRGDLRHAVGPPAMIPIQSQIGNQAQQTNHPAPR